MADEQTFTPGKYVTLSQVKALIEKEQAIRDELTYEQKLALDHSTSLARIPPDKVEALVGEIKALGGRITEWHAYKIADIVPTHADDLRAIFQKDRVTPEADEIEKILEIVRGYI